MQLNADEEAVTTEPKSVALRELNEGLKIRLGEKDLQHVRALAENHDQLPPILVHHPSMAVIDGVHRVAASKLLGMTTIPALFFYGSEGDAYVEGIRANIGHGRPLTLGDRRCAAQRLVKQHPDWSDRRLAEVCGLSPKTIGVIRRRATVESPQLRVRTGMDGKVRPLDPGPARERVAELIKANPTSSLKDLANGAGCSVTTALKVRRRLEQVDEPLPRPGAKPPANGPAQSVSDRWTQDAALASSETSADFAKWFEYTSVGDGDAERFAGRVPVSRAYLVSDEARRRARFWQEFALAVESNVSGPGRGRRPDSGWGASEADAPDALALVSRNEEVAAR